MAGIQETKEMLDFLIAIGNGFGKAWEDEQWSTGDIAHFFDVLLTGPAAFKGIEQIPGEVSDLTKEEVQELEDYLITEFDIPQNEVEDIIERAIKLAIDLWEFISKIRGL